MVAHRTLAHLNLRSGWSLTEGLLAMAILATMTALAVPVLENQEQVTPGVRRFLADAVRARSLAQSSWQEIELKLDIASGSWRIEGQDGSIHPGALANATGWANLGNGLSFLPAKEAPPVFRFQANGRAKEKGAIQIRAGKSSWLIHLDRLSSTLTATPVGQ